MNAYSEKEFIRVCKRQIAEKLQLGKEGGKLRSRDFEYLASSIESSSGIKLSVSTLKRIWKNDYDQAPHPATLNALVSVLDYEDWQDFKQGWKGEGLPVEPATGKRNLTAVMIPLLLCSILLIVFFNRNTGIGALKIPPLGQSVKVLGEVLFTADKMEREGVPNTVIFNYDVSQIEADSFFIQQSWNPDNKVRIDPNRRHFSSIYYTPGFHYARLIANDSIIRYQPVHIRSDGWLPVVKYNIRDLEPIYLPPEKVETDGSLHTSREVLNQVGIDTDRDFYLRYYLVEDFGNISFDNFRLRTRIRVDSTGNTVCPLMELMIITEGDVSYVGLTPKGCVANLAILIGGEYRSASQYDLSAFGADVYQWQDLEFKVVDKNATVLVNDRPVYELTYKRDFGKVVGVILTYKGIGSMEYLHLMSLDDHIQVSAN